MPIQKESKQPTVWLEQSAPHLTKITWSADENWIKRSVNRISQVTKTPSSYTSISKASQDWYSRQSKVNQESKVRISLCFTQQEHTLLRCQVMWQYVKIHSLQWWLRAALFIEMKRYHSNWKMEKRLKAKNSYTVIKIKNQ